jgi:hypothetical protein
MVRAKAKVQRVSGANVPLTHRPIKHLGVLSRAAAFPRHRHPVQRVSPRHSWSRLHLRITQDCEWLRVRQCCGTFWRLMPLRGYPRNRGCKSHNPN